MKKRIIALCAAGVVLLVAGFMALQTKPKDVHYHAGFLVYVNGVQQDFSDPKYDKISPCAMPGAAVSGNPELEKAHLHDKVGDVVHVEGSGAVWGDLFKNIHYVFKKDVPVQGFISGKEVPNILTYPIKAYDSIIIVVGSGSGVDLNKVVTKNHIVEVERKGESCGL
jgi:hypothetical protein